MPIDPTIPLGIRPIQLPNPLEAIQQAQQIQLQRQTAAALEGQRLSQAQLRQEQSEKLRRDAEREAAGSAAVDQLFSTYDPGKPMDYGAVGKLYQSYGPERTTAIIKGLHDFGNADITDADTLRKSMLTRIAAVKALPPDKQEGAYNAVVQDYTKRGALKPEEVAPYSPQQLDAYEQQLMTPEQRYAAAHQKPVAVQPGSTLVNPQTGTPIYTAPPKETHSPAYTEWQDAKANGYTGSFTQYQNEDANRKRPVTNIAGENAISDVKEAVAGMKEGTIPPQLPGRASKEYTATMAEAHRQGYDLQAAVTDWNATQKHIASMNGAQQLRLNQSINALPEMLDSVDALATKWKAGRFAVLNKANLAAAKQGLYGKDAASLATQLDAQIADVTADLGNVYMGGNSPTDHALGLASQSLKAEWDEKVLHDMVALARKNVGIRSNSIKNTGVAGASAANPYAPPAPPPPTAPASGERVRIKGPNGETGTVPKGTALPAGWSVIGG